MNFICMASLSVEWRIYDLLGCKNVQVKYFFFVFFVLQNYNFRSTLPEPNSSVNGSALAAAAPPPAVSRTRIHKKKNSKVSNE